MRVALDTNCLYVTRAGVARYVRGLQTGLRELAAPDLDIRPLAWPVENFGYRQPVRALKTAWRELVWAPLAAPRRLRREGAQVLHHTSALAIGAPPGVARVLTLYDLAMLREPRRFRRWHRWSRRRFLRSLAGSGRFARVICISRFTADEAVALLGLDPRRLEVAHGACDLDPAAAADSAELAGLGVPDEFFLFVGSLEPGKNLALLRQTYALADAAGAALPPLLIVGQRWRGVAGEGAPHPAWRYLGRQSDAVLTALYQRALALAFPSRYEGFGLPVLEAMSLGCPVICSRVASLPEVGGEAPWYAEATPAAYLAALRAVAGDARLRAELSAQGRAQSRRFSWRECARVTADVYRSVV